MRWFLCPLLCCLVWGATSYGDKPAEPSDQAQAEKKTDGDKGKSVVVGYRYKSDAKMKSVFVPRPLPGGQKTFELVVGEKTFPLEAGKRFSFIANGFQEGVDAFLIRGINESEKLGPDDPRAFPTGISFMKDGVLAEISVLPITK